MFDIRENLKKLPDCPGVYIHKDKIGGVIYVGKAVSLKNRVRQYFQSSRNMDPKVRAMVSHIAEFEYITCGSEMEAFILENNLIKKYKPKYNILLRDDKTYPYIAVTAGEKYPRLFKTRLQGRKGCKYFGPYSDAGAVNQMVDLLNDIYKLKRCTPVRFPKNFRPCLNYHIRKCDGICTGSVDADEYRRRVDSAMDYLRGRDRSIEDHLRSRMEEAAAELDYEEAALYRDRLEAARALHEKQRVVLHHGKDIDVVLSAGSGHIVQFFVRDGKLTGRETFMLQTTEGDSERDSVSAFIRQHYGQQSGGPAEILVRELPEEAPLIEQFLNDRWGRSVTLAVPKRGEKKALLDLAYKDVMQMAKTIDEREQNRRDREKTIRDGLQELIADMGHKAAVKDKYRVEAYDISNTNGIDTVGAMAVFRGTRPDKREYRKFRVRTVDGPDDYAGMQEVLFRRFRRAQENDPGFSDLPDLILIDGGRGHVAAAEKVLAALRIDIPAAGMVKDDAHRTRGLVYIKGEDFIEKELKEYPLLFKYAGTVQEEVHRFAIEYHRGLRDGRALTSALDEIEGIGPKKRSALLAHFGSIDRIKSASAEELKTVPGITDGLVVRIKEFFD